MEKMKNIFGRNMAKMLVFLIGGILVLGLLSYGLLTLSKTVSGQGHKIEICTYYQDNSTKNLSNSAGTISVNGNISDSVQGRVGSAVTLSATPNENYQFMGFYRDLEFTDVISRDSSCVYEISAEDAKIFAQFLKVYPVTFTFQDSNFNAHTITKKFPYGYTFGQEEIKELIEQEAGEAGLSVFENKLAKLNPTAQSATDTTSTNMCFTVGSGASFFNLTPAALDDVGISGSGTSASPYLIANATDLSTFRGYINNNTNRSAHGKLTANITLSGTWTPIGNSTYPYAGTFDGVFFSVSGLSISTTSTHQGLFGYANGATIKNLTVNGSVTGAGSYHAGVCGYGISTNFLFCTNNATVQCYQYGGGICGTLESGTVDSCSNTGSLSCTYSSGQPGHVSGIVAVGSASLVIKNCFNTGTISANAGQLHGITRQAQSIVNCFNLGNITSTHSSGTAGMHIGGICQGGNKSVYNCYNSGTIKATLSNAGGICDGYEAGSIFHCYNSGSVTASLYAYSTSGRNVTTTNCSNFTHTSGTTTNTLSSSITVSGYSATTVLLTVLNNWVNANNSDGSYSLWATSTSVNNGYPYLVDAVGVNLTYNANGGSGAPANQTSTNGKITISSTKPTKTGYTFKGWGTTSSTSTVSYNGGSTYTFAGDVTIYAVWQANTYTVAYNANGGTGTTASSSHTYDVSKALTSNGFSKTGYNFAGWDKTSAGTTVNYTNGQSVSNLSSTQGATVTLYAVWKANTYTVVYNANGGLGSMANSSHTYDTAKALTANSFTRLGYTFLGWNTSSTATSVKYVNQESVKNLTTTNNGTVTLYAVWGYTYAVQYNGNGAISGSTATSVHTYNLSAALTSNGFSRTGYTFLGWSTSSAASSATYTDKQSVSNLATTQYETVTLYAVWQGNSYTVKYNANGGSGSMSNSSHVYGTESRLTANAFTRTGYIFDGWALESNATSEIYDDKEFVWNLTTTAGATVNLYAVWSKKDITVTVDPNGGVYNGVETATIYNCSVGSDLVLGVPSRPGYEFTEFNTSGDGMGQTLNGTMVLNSDVTFYALWEPLNYYIKYYDGDLYLGQTEAWYNENLSLPRWETLLSNNSLTGGKFTEYGWNFAGWTADSNGTAVQHTNGGAVLNLTEAGTTINLYAMHTQTLNLTYNGNGSISGEVANQSSDLMLNSKSEKITDFVIKLANNSYSKTNYTFKNWAIGSTSGTQKSAGANITNVDLNLTYSSTFNITIYAIWQGNSYTINYYNGTSKISTGNYVYGTSATLKTFSTIGTVTNLAYGWEFYGWSTANNTFTRVFVDSANITNISVENGSEITQNMVINLYSIYSREVSFVSGLNKASTTTATQFWNPYSTENSNLSSVLAEAPQTIETGNWTALGYRADLTAGTATFALTTTTEIRPAANTFNTLYAVYSRTITIADLNATTTATQYYNSAGTVSTVGQ